MNRTLSRTRLIFTSAVVGVVASLSPDQADAQSIDLLALGINANFETPEQVHSNTAENGSNANVGTGWTFSILSGTAANYGVADPNETYYGPFSGPAPTGTLPAPFEGRQYGFINLNDTDSMAQIVSKPVGTLLAGQSYTLNVAVGARANDTWANVMYAIGLQSASGIDLGAFTLTTLDPSTLTPTNITDLQYTLNVNSQAAAFVGQEASIVIRAMNATNGPSPPDFTQANFDNVRLTGAFGAVSGNETLLTINRTTGAVSLSKTGASTFNITGYELTSDTYGSFNQANWTKISVAYDASGNQSVDNDNNWTVLSAAGDSTDLSEAELQGGNGGTVGAGSPIALGTPWRRTPYQDVQAKVLLAGGTELIVPVVYTGNTIIAGDFNGDSVINGGDWTIFKAGQGVDMSSLTITQAYQAGDMNADRVHNLVDFSQFRTAYDAVNGAGAFAVMVAAVPEPSSLTLLGAAATFAALASRRRRRLGTIQKSLMPTGLRLASIAAFSIVFLSSTGDESFAQTIGSIAIPNHDFETLGVLDPAAGGDWARRYSMSFHATPDFMAMAT